MKRSLTIFLQAVIVFVGVGALALLLWEPQVEGVNTDATNFEIYFKDPFLALVYAGSIPFFIALYQTFKILRCVGQDKVFSPEVIKSLRTIKHCAAAIVGFVAIEEIFIILNHGSDDATGGIMMGVFIVFGSVVVAAVAEMFEGILQKALHK